MVYCCCVKPKEAPPPDDLNNEEEERKGKEKEEAAKNDKEVKEKPPKQKEEPEKKINKDQERNNENANKNNDVSAPGASDSSDSLPTARENTLRATPAPSNDRLPSEVDAVEPSKKDSKVEPEVVVPAVVKTEEVKPKSKLAKLERKN